MNLTAIRAIYVFEMARTFRTLLQSIVSPVISTALYFVVFGAAIGSRIDEVEGVPYGAFIVPGLIMLSVLVQSVSNASFGIYFPKFIGTVYELLSAPASFLEITAGYVLAAATKSLMIGLIILATAYAFVDITILHPVWMIGFLLLTCLSFSLLGFIIGIWAPELRAVAAGPVADHHAADLSGRVVLLHHHAATGLAEDHPVQPGGLPGLGIPLVVLRAVGTLRWAGRCWRSSPSPQGASG